MVCDCSKRKHTHHPPRDETSVLLIMMVSAAVSVLLLIMGISAGVNVLLIIIVSVID